MPEIEYPDPPLSDGLLVLRPASEEDVPAITAACQDPLIPRFTKVPYNYREADARAWREESERQRRQGTGIHLLVGDQSTGTLVGAVGLLAIDWEDLRGNLGYWTAAEARGRGVATGAARMLSGWALRSLGLARVQIYVDLDNPTSQRVAERAGFVREGVLRSHSQRKGERYDVVIFSFLAADLGGASK